MSRFLLIDTDGATILATLWMPEAEALANAGSGQTIVSIAPATDTGGFIDDAVIEYSAVDGLVLIADGTPSSDFTDMEMDVVTP